MKKTLIIFASMLCFSIHGAQAQSWLDALKGLQKNNTTTTETTNDSTSQSSSTKSALSGIGSLITGLLGTANVNANSIVGTWTYKQPAVIFESENMLTNVGAMAAGKTIETKLQGYLDKVGFTAGKVKMTFKDGGSGSLTYGNKNIPFQWSVEGTEMTIKLGSNTLSKLSSALASSEKLSKFSSFTVNCKQNITSLQLSFKADKLMEFFNKVLAATGKSANSSTLNTISSLTSQVNGMYLGLTLEK